MSEPAAESPLHVPGRPRIDSFVVADHAEAINGKLYLMGGGFDTIGAPNLPFLVRFSIAAILKVPWSDTNRRFPLSATLATADGEELDWRMEGELEAGRAPGSRAGGDVTIVIAGPVQFEAEDAMDLVARLQFDTDERTLALRLLHVPVPGARPPGT